MLFVWDRAPLGTDAKLRVLQGSTYTMRVIIQESLNVQDELLIQPLQSVSIGN